MGKTYDEITPELAAWLGQQRMFLVATAPLAGDGLVNCSPKGMDTFRIVGPREVAYLDLTGSGIETVAHVRENGRIVLVFCAFDGPPKIVRLHGVGEVLELDSPEYLQWHKHFPDHRGTRSIIRIQLTRISDSCGYGVPRYHYVEDRNTLCDYAEAKGPEWMANYRREKNAQSLDGLPGLISSG